MILQKISFSWNLWFYIFFSFKQSFLKKGFFLLVHASQNHSKLSSNKSENIFFCRRKNFCVNLTTSLSLSLSLSFSLFLPLSPSFSLSLCFTCIQNRHKTHTHTHSDTTCLRRWYLFFYEKHLEIRSFQNTAINVKQGFVPRTVNTLVVCE